ncbi:MAG: AAA family ATPase [Actinomycetota bacterium]
MLLERGDLLGVMRGHLERAASDGGGALVLLAGEAGAGKTSMVRALADSVDPATRVLVGACDNLTTPRPLGPLHDIAAAPGSGLAGLMDGDRSAVERFAEVRDVLRSGARATLMVVEDAHWADEATLDLLRFLGRRIAETRAVLVVTYRDDEVGVDHPLRPVLGQLLPIDSTDRIVVEPLSLAAVSRLVLETPVSGPGVADPAELHRVSGGNPFFVTEILAAGSTGSTGSTGPTRPTADPTATSTVWPTDGPTTVPATVQDAVLARLAAVDPDARRVVEAVSIAPRHLELDRVVALTATTAAAVDRAVDGGILLAEGNRLRFRHELARAAVEETLPPARRLGLHRAMIDLLDGDDEDRDLAALAHHAVRADVPDLIVRHAREAGREAAARGARRQAIEFYRACLAHHRRLDASAELDARLALVDQLRIVDRQTEALLELDRAIALGRELDDVESLAEALSLRPTIVWNTELDAAEGREAADEALRLLRRRGPSEGLARHLYRTGHLHMLARRREPASAAVREAAAMAEEVGSEEVRWLASMMAGCIDLVLSPTDGGAVEGADRLELALAEAEALGRPGFRSIALGMLGTGGGEARLYARAIPALEQGIAQGLATDEDYAVAYNRAWLARIAFEQGRWDDATDLVALVERTTNNQTGIAGLTAGSVLGRVRVRRGDPGGIELLDRMIELGRGHELQHAWTAICGRAEGHWLAGNDEAVVDVVTPAYERALVADSPWARGELGFWLWRVGAIDEPPADSAEPFALQMAGQWREAAEHWADIGCPYESAMALADGDADAVTRGLAAIDGLGAAPAGRRLRRGLRAAGVDRVPRGPVPATRANPAGLTARQLDVLRLIVDGRTNTEIATQLFVAKKTVEHHVSAVYAKLGVTDRAKAIAAARDRGLVLPTSG